MSKHSIGIPAERYYQLQALADRGGLTVADLIGEFIKIAIREKRIPPDIPGWVIEKVGDDVRFAVDAIERRLTKANAISLADSLQRCSVPAGRTGAVLDVDAGMLKVERRGTSVRITDEDTGAMRATARSVAADVAKLLRQAAV